MMMINFISVYLKRKLQTNKTGTDAIAQFHSITATAEQHVGWRISRSIKNLPSSSGIAPPSPYLHFMLRINTIYIENLFQKICKLRVELQAKRIIMYNGEEPFSGIIFVPNLVKILQLVRKLLGGKK